MGLTAKEAAAEVGMSRQGIMKAIHQGKISAQKDSNGQWSIEPVELFRVYEPVRCEQLDATEDATSSQEHTPQGATVALARENDLLWRMIADKDNQITDLRQRLDAATEQNTRLEAVLTTQLQPAKAKAGWWQRLLGGQ